MISEGFYSILRYTPDSARGEAKNVALMLVDERRDIARLRVAPLSQITPKLNEHGVLDKLLVQFGSRLQAGELRDQAQVNALSRAIGPTLSLTAPIPAAIGDNVDATLKALYMAFVAPRQSRDAGISHGQLLDRLVKACRKAGAAIEPGAYVGDMLFDAILSGLGRRTPVQILSFDGASPNPRGLEQAAGYFLFALNRIHEDGLCVMQPPPEHAIDPARASYRRIRNWMEDGRVETIGPEGLPSMAASMSGAELLPLVMST
jgi:hypothetical protein